MKKHKSADTLDTNVKPSAVSVAPHGDSEFAVPNAPRRKKKERKENVPPSPSLEHRAPNSIERVKAALQNSGEQGRISRARPASVMQTSYTGSVERARQNFQSKPKNGEDTTSVSEKSMDSRGENEQDDEYDRYPVSVSLSANEKAWMLKSCQGDMVEMRKLLDNDSTLLEKKDFISGTALHWAAKKGNKDMLHMLLDLKVEVNVKSNGGYTPLHLAAMNGHEDIIISLLQHDANPKMRDFSGRLPIHYLKLDMSLPLQSKPPLSNPQHVSKHGVVSSRAVLSAGGVARWKRHIFAGTCHGHTVSHATQDMLSQKDIAWKEPDRGEEADCLEPMPPAPISTERKESAGNGAHKGTKLSRKNSVLTSFGMGKRKTSMRKSKNGHDKNDHGKNGHDNGNSGEVVPLPTNKAYINHTKMWKPAGPKN
uniref:ankyrin repeat domain-containing protein SOWAHC isoform X1 n=1 Tax=Ciona intestinalis TaxID=7719 RepID=UPI000EF4D22C|nr:ankyrin repeat domain-containing protein SOWAHC isoform X1 [Ciona intestinalis]|eukprot:XP_026690322.1 ankyrin repeat domain-containing protein SOWAHC isoform X1 [Ciona intestinalis]